MKTLLALLDWLRILPLFPLPHHALSRVVWFLTRRQLPWWKNLLIRVFIRLFHIDMSPAKVEDPQQYPSFNHFFTRELKTEARPIADKSDALVSPVDGTVSQLGTICADDLIQAKGRNYTLQALLADAADTVDIFRNGSFMTIYLSPRDYHRIHMPVAGTLIRMTYVPGRLFPVNRPATRRVANLFARNERIISLFDTSAGMMAMINVGALFVGSMDTVWAGSVTPARERCIIRTEYTQQQPAIQLRKGEEMGRFNMGSTVILLFEPGRIEWKGGLESEAGLLMGESIGRCIVPRSSRP